MQFHTDSPIDLIWASMGLLAATLLLVSWTMPYLSAGARFLKRSAIYPDRRTRELAELAKEIEGPKD